MPTYEYKCKICNKVYEKFHSIKETPEIKCEKCNSILVRGIGGGVGFKIINGGTRKIRRKNESKV